jgi:hypothetical protein
MIGVAETHHLAPAPSMRFIVAIALVSSVTADQEKQPSPPHGRQTGSLG